MELYITRKELAAIRDDVVVTIEDGKYVAVGYRFPNGNLTLNVESAYIEHHQEKGLPEIGLYSFYDGTVDLVKVIHVADKLDWKNGVNNMMSSIEHAVKTSLGVGNSVHIISEQQLLLRDIVVPAMFYRQRLFPDVYVLRDSLKPVVVKICDYTMNKSNFDLTADTGALGRGCYLRPCFVDDMCAINTKDFANIFTIDNPLPVKAASTHGMSLGGYVNIANASDLANISHVCSIPIALLKQWILLNTKHYTHFMR